MLSLMSWHRPLVFVGVSRISKQSCHQVFMVPQSEFKSFVGMTFLEVGKLGPFNIFKDVIELSDPCALLVCVWAYVHDLDVNMQKEFLDSGGRGGNHKKKDGDKVGTKSSTRPVEIMVSSLDGSEDNCKSPTDVPNSSNDKDDEGEQHVNFRSLDTDKPINAKVEVKIPKASVWKFTRDLALACMVISWGKRLAFTVVEYYVKNAWQKEWSLVYSICSYHSEEMDATANLLKEDLILVPICVKLHDISIVAFTTDGLSVMANRLGRMDYDHALIDIRVDRELKDEMIIAIPNVEDDEEVLHTVRVEHTSRSTNMGPKVQYKPKKQVYQAVSKKNGVNSSVADSAFSSSSTTPLVARINELESQMLDGKFVLLGDDGKPRKPYESTFLSSSNVASKKVDDPVNEDSDDEVLEVYNETATFMASINVHEASKSGSGGGNKSLYEQWKDDHYEDRYNDDDFDDHGLTPAQMRFVDAFDISLRG
ncbi:hypothetical protein Tco_0884679 [Tanacetum coccineum]